MVGMERDEPGRAGRDLISEDLRAGLRGLKFTMGMVGALTHFNQGMQKRWKENKTGGWKTR